MPAKKPRRPSVRAIARHAALIVILVFFIFFFCACVAELFVGPPSFPGYAGSFTSCKLLSIRTFSTVTGIRTRPAKARAAAPVARFAVFDRRGSADVVDVVVEFCAKLPLPFPSRFKLPVPATTSPSLSTDSRATSLLIPFRVVK